MFVRLCTMDCHQCIVAIIVLIVVGLVDGTRLHHTKSSLIKSSPPPSAEALFSPLLPARCPSPPCFCDVDSLERKVVTCETGISTIPVTKMDPLTQVLNVTAPNGRFNSISLGKIFSSFIQLEEVHITRSKLPMIGESTFCSSWCRSSPCHSTIRVLNLSQNNLQHILRKDFNCLEQLEVLDLSDNSLSSVPSASFSRLSKLTKLSLARNKLSQLSPLMFYSLSSLLELDLSENPMSEINQDVLRNVSNLHRLILYGCQLTKINEKVFDALPNLEYLDISENHLKHFDQSAFAGLKKLKVLLLNRNSITVLSNNIFSGLSLDLLDLSENLINPMTSCTFCNVTTIKYLDISRNKFTSFSPSLLEPVSTTLERLYLDGNQNLIDPPSSIVALLQPLKRLKYLSLVSIGLDENLSESTFDNSVSLVYLNISNNQIHELSGRLFSQLTYLHTLDVSNNQLTFLGQTVLKTFSGLKFLSRLYIEQNPFSCYRCHILPLIEWLKNDPSPYWSVCAKLTDDPGRLVHCGQCASPSSLGGRYLHEADLIDDLEWCTNPEVHLRLTASEPQVGLILGFLIILSLLAVILVVVAIYRTHGAVYYTQESKLTLNDDMCASEVGPISRTHTLDSRPNRMVSLSSTNNSMSRQNTMFSPQSSLDQTPNVHYGTVMTSPIHDHSSLVGGGGGVCETCANSTAVKQVIASIPAMTEMLENSLHKVTNPTANGIIGSNHCRMQPPPALQHGPPKNGSNNMVTIKEPEVVPVMEDAGVDLPQTLDSNKDQADPQPEQRHEDMIEGEKLLNIVNSESQPEESSPMDNQNDTDVHIYI